MAHGPEKPQKAQSMRKAAELILAHDPVNVIGRPLGLDDESIKRLVPATGIITAVFDSRQAVDELVREMKREKLDVSVVLSGLFSDVREVCKGSGLKEHTYHISLGVYGRTEKLPDERTMKITTQCGHALISPHLVAAVVKKIRKGKMTVEDATQLLVKPCACGIGNTTRIEGLLAEMV